MPELVVTSVLILAAAYLLCGLLFAVYFLSKGIHKIDEGAHGSSFTFHLVIVSGVIVFWMVLLNKILKAK